MSTGFNQCFPNNKYRAAEKQSFCGSPTIMYIFSKPVK